MKSRVAGLALLALSATSALAAQRSAPIPPLLLLPGSTRAMGLGNAYVAGSGPDVISYNPAQVGESRGTVLSWQSFAGNASLASLATNTSVFGASIGAGVQYLEFRSRNTDGATPSGALTRGGQYTASSVLGLLSASVERSGIRVGVTTKYLAQQLANGRRSVPMLDFGIATDLGPATVALVLQDADALLGDAPASGLTLPTRMTLGGMSTGIPVGTWFDVGASAAVSIDAESRVLPAGGVELSYLPVSGWSFTGRIGGQRIAQPYRSGESALTLGATISIDRFALDYAFQQYSGPGATHRVGVRIR